MYQVDEHEGGGLPRSDRVNGELTPRIFTVEGVPQGSDPTMDPQIPIWGHMIEFNGKQYICDWVGVTETIRWDKFIVEARYSSDGRFTIPESEPDANVDELREFDLTYAKETLRIPSFKAGEHLYSIGPGLEVGKLWWYREDIEVGIEHVVLNINVTLDARGHGVMIDAIKTIMKQVGRMHIIPAFAPWEWIMRAPTIRGQTAPVDGRIHVAYTWIHDPGNDAIDVDPDLQVPIPARPSWHKYVVRPAPTGPEEKPIIELQDMRPAGDFYNPDGCRFLPGDPI